jgi:hypothetical protein
LATGIVDQVVDQPALCHHAFHHGLDRVFITDIAHLKTGLAAVLNNLAAGGFKLFHLAPDQHHVGTQVRQFMGGATADAAAAAGDHDGLAAKQAGFKD